MSRPGNYARALKRYQGTDGSEITDVIIDDGSQYSGDPSVTVNPGLSTRDWDASTGVFSPKTNIPWGGTTGDPNVLIPMAKVGGPNYQAALKSFKKGGAKR